MALPYVLPSCVSTTHWATGPGSGPWYRSSVVSSQLLGRQRLAYGGSIGGLSSPTIGCHGHVPFESTPAPVWGDPADAAVLLGQQRRAQGEPQQALQEFQRAVALNPMHTRARELLATQLQDMGQSAAAFEQFLRLNALDPTNALYCTNLGVTSQRLENFAAAVHWYQQAIRVAPTYAVPYSNLANCFKVQGNMRAAEALYRQAILLDPKFADAHSNYGNLLKECGRPEEAIVEYRQAIALQPGHANAWSNPAGTLKDMARVPEAIDAYRALDLVPKLTVALSNLIHCLTIACDWKARDALLPKLQELLKDQVARNDYTHTVQPHHALAYPVPAETHIFIATTFALGVERAANRLLQACPTRPLPVRRPWVPGTERLRIGYLSSDFGNHPLSQLMQRYFGMHDRKRVEVFDYALSAPDGTAARRMIEEGTEHFFDVHSTPVVELDALMRSHRLHILIDLNGYTKGARTEVLALRPAPVQVHYMGFAGTLGASFIDYLISDESHPAEVPSPAEVAALRASLGLPTDRFVFGCFNQLYKIDATVFGVWARLLQAQPDAVLWLLRFPPAAEEFLRRTAEQDYGLSKDRLVFTSVALDKAAYMRFIPCADLALDTLQYNGHTSACDVLWAGVPVVTAPQRHMAGRVCASVLRALDCPELVCPDLVGYEQLAGRLASLEGRSELAALRAKVQRNRMTAPLFDTQRWVRDVEVLLMAMALRDAEGLPPDHLFFRDAAKLVKAKAV